MMKRYERRCYVDCRLAGVVHAATGIFVAAVIGVGLRKLFGACVATVVAGSLSIAGRMLERESSRVKSQLESGDLAGARDSVSRLVGRDTENLDEEAVARATIETLAENTVDAVLGSMFWGAVAGAPGVLVHRAVNTMDAMVGHRSERFERYGWAVARADDALNWVPARLGVAATLLVRPADSASVIRAVVRDAPKHPSPNGGVIEASFAAALGVRLGGVNRYEGRLEDRGHLGLGREPMAPDIERAVKLAQHVTVMTGGLLIGGRHAMTTLRAMIRLRALTSLRARCVR